jgi:hypothetical protein
MNTKHLLVSALLLALAGCAVHDGMRTMGSGRSANDRCAGHCPVRVDVVMNPDGTCKITAPLSTDAVFVDKSPNPTTIEWKISGNPPAFRFASPEGIKFDKGTSPPPRGANGQGGAPVTTVTNLNLPGTPPARFRYSIHVTNGTANCSLDPWIDNN